LLFVNTSLNHVDEFEKFLGQNQTSDGPVMCHIKIKTGTIDNLTRPEESPIKQRDDFMKYLQKAKQLESGYV